MQSIQPGTVAPDIEVTTLDGQAFKLSSLRGKLVLLDFWATWCPPCVAELPNIKKAHDAFAAEGFTVVSVSFDRDAETAGAFARKNKMTWPQLWAEKADKGPIANRYGVGGIPATFLIGADGKVIERDLRGDGLYKAVRREMRKLRKGPVAGEAVAEGGGLLSGLLAGLTGRSAEQIAQLAQAQAADEAARAAAEQEDATLDVPAARAVLERTLARYRALTSYRDQFRATARIVSKGEEKPVVGTLEGSLALVRPDRLVVKCDRLHAYYDGKQMTRYEPEPRQYMVSNDSNALHQLATGRGATPFMPAAGGHPLLALLAPGELSPDDVLTVTAVLRAEEAPRDGRASREITGHVKLADVPGGHSIPFVARVDERTDLFEEIRLDVTAAARAAAAEDPEAGDIERAEVILVFENVQTDGLAADDPVFTFNPAGARKIDEFEMASQRKAASPVELLGMTAPRLVGPLADGKAFDLAGQRGRVAVVAFWGTWAPGSERVLRELEEVSSSLEGREACVVGVVRNDTAGEAAVQKLLERSGARFGQVRDTSDECADAWHLAALPVVFLVDRQGVVAEVYTRWTDTSREGLAAAAERLLKGEALHSAEGLAALRATAMEPQHVQGLRLRAPEHPVGEERLRVLDGDSVNGSRWNMSQTDVNGDGQPELVFPDWRGGLSVVDVASGTVQRVQLRCPGNMQVQSVEAVLADGQICWLCGGTQYSSSYATQRGRVTLHAPGGEVLWTFEPEVAEGASAQVCAAAGDLDGDGAVEFAIGLTTYVQERMAENSWTMSDMQGRLYILDARGAVIAQHELAGQVELLYVPSQPPGRPAPLLCIAGGELQRFELEKDRQVGARSGP